MTPNSRRDGARLTPSERDATLDFGYPHPDGVDCASCDGVWLRIIGSQRPTLPLDVIEHYVIAFDLFGVEAAFVWTAANTLGITP